MSGGASSGSIKGRVLFEGKPVSHCGIAFTQPHVRFSGGHETIRAPDGCFALAGLGAGTWQLMLVGPVTRTKQLEPITLNDGELVDLGDIVLESGRRIAGLVRDASGAPVAGARVFIGSGPGEPRSPDEIIARLIGRYATSTDSRGMYAVEGVDIPKGTGPRYLWATKSLIGASRPRELQGDDSKVDLVLHRTGSIRGVVEGVGGRLPFVFTRSPEEPEQARRVLTETNGEFWFDDVPAGEYDVCLRVPQAVHAPPVRVTVVEEQVAFVTLTMVTSAVQLTITVPPGCGVGLVLASADSKTPEPEELTPKFIMTETRIKMKNGPSPPWSGKESVMFQYLLPGRYRASIDGETWTPIVVAAAPEHQCFEIGTG